MKNKLLPLLAAIFIAAWLAAPAGDAQVEQFGYGMRIPAGSCVSYSNTPKAQILSSSGGLLVFNPDGRIDVHCVCQLPVPEKARIRQVVMVGNVTKGELSAELGGVRWNAPRQHLRYATLKMTPNTTYEISEMKQKKVVANLPAAGRGSLTTDRLQTYFIQTRFTSDSALNIEEALELFYFEIYWD